MQDLHPDFISILNDKSSGSMELLEKINAFVIANANLIINNSKYIDFLSKKFSSFETILSYIDKLKAQTNSEALKNFAIKFASDEKNIFSNLYSNAKKILFEFNSFLTLSNSKTLLEIFGRLKKDKPDIRITVCESRPKNEGVIMAERLSALGITINLITEAQIAWALLDCDCVVLGADKILPDGDIINKTGSLTAAVCAKQLGKPVYVLADKSKYSNSNSFIPEEYPSSEICPESDFLIKVTNYYFERVNKTYITNIITD